MEGRREKVRTQWQDGVGNIQIWEDADSGPKTAVHLRSVRYSDLGGRRLGTKDCGTPEVSQTFRSGRTPARDRQK